MTTKLFRNVSFSDDWDSEDIELDGGGKWQSKHEKNRNGKLGREQSFVEDDLDIENLEQKEDDQLSFMSAETILGAPTLPLHNVDFFPKLQAAEKTLRPENIQPFSDLVNEANEWLFNNSSFRAEGCESVPLPLPTPNKDSQTFNVENMMYETPQMSANYRGLRLWIAPKSGDGLTQPQKLSYINSVPEISSEQDDSRDIPPVFETYSKTIQRLNDKIINQRITGKILNLETYDLLFTRWDPNKCDPDATYCEQIENKRKYVLKTIRLFFEIGPQTIRKIEYRDFIPNKLKKRRPEQPVQYENLCTVVARARIWYTSQPGLSVTSVQSLNYTWDRTQVPEYLDSERTLSQQVQRGYTEFLRIVRIIYERPLSARSARTREQPCLSYRTFIPVMTTEGNRFTKPRFENLTDTVDRAAAWLFITGVRMLSMETVPVKMLSNRNITDPEETTSYVHSDDKGHSLYVIRAYLDGDYIEPSPDDLPHVPEVTDGCCSVS